MQKTNNNSEWILVQNKNNNKKQKNNKQINNKQINNVTNINDYIRTYIYNILLLLFISRY